MRSDIVPGAIFPDYELSDHTAKRRKLSELQEQDPMVLVLSRGGFCPKERRQAEGLVRLHRELEVGYCRLVTMRRGNKPRTPPALETRADCIDFSAKTRRAAPAQSRHSGDEAPVPDG